jgi:hypothetical protein
VKKKSSEVLTSYFRDCPFISGDRLIFICFR